MKGSYSSNEGNYAIFFNCTNCNTKNQRTFPKSSYHHGSVVIRCEGCQGLHLIADHLDMFGRGDFNIEDYMKENNK